MRLVERAYLGLLGLLAGFAALIFAAIAVLIPVNVVLRNLWGGAIYGLLDGIEYGLLAATFLAAPWVLARDAHVSVDIFVNLFGRRKAVVLAAVNALGAVLAGLFFYYSLDATLQAMQRGTLVRQTLVFPEWWALSVMPLSMALMVAEFIRRLVRGPGEHGQVGL